MSTERLSRQDMILEETNFRIVRVTGNSQGDASGC